MKPTTRPAVSDERRHTSVKFRVERDVLAEAVTWTARSLSPRPPGARTVRPAHQGRSRHRQPLASFDYETSARLEIPADIRPPRHILVSGRLLADICRSLPSAPVDVETDGNKVIVTCRQASFHLATMPEEEYPPLPGLRRHQRHGPGRFFRPGRHPGDHRRQQGRHPAILTGVRMEIEDDLITLLATDRYRLAMRELTWKPVTRASPPAPWSRPDTERSRQDAGRQRRHQHCPRRRRQPTDRLRERRPDHHVAPGGRRLPQDPFALPGLHPHPRHRADPDARRGRAPRVARRRAQHPVRWSSPRASCTWTPAPARTPRPPKSSSAQLDRR